MGVSGEGRSARVLALHLPAFRLERCGYAADDVAGLIAERKSAARLVALTPAARAAGLREDMTATEARARCPEVVLEPLDPRGEADDRDALLQALARFSDRLFPLSEDDLALHVEGTARRFGGEAGLCAVVRDFLAELGHASCAAVADEPLAARALARFGPNEALAPPGQAAEALAPLPLAALFPSAELALALDTLGLERVGQLARLDPASVAGRFGEEGVRLHRVARGLWAGGAAPPGWVEPEVVEARAVLGGPTTQLEPILFVLAGLLRQVAGALVRRDRAIVRLALRLVLEPGAGRTLRLRVGRPTRNPELLLRILRTRLHDLRVEAPVVEVLLEVEESVPVPVWQLGLMDRKEQAEPVQDLLARLVDALGEQALFCPEPVEDWCPERAWRAVPIDPSTASELALRPPRRRARPRSGDRVDPVEALEAWERRVPRPRPTRLLARPQAIEIRLAAGAPVGVHLERGWERILAAEGPERLCGAWWSASQVFDRAYWVVRLAHGSGWVFQERSRWFWHGWFD